MENPGSPRAPAGSTSVSAVPASNAARASMAAGDTDATRVWPFRWARSAQPGDPPAGRGARADPWSLAARIGGRHPARRSGVRLLVRHPGPVRAAGERASIRARLGPRVSCLSGAQRRTERRGGDDAALARGGAAPGWRHMAASAQTALSPNRGPNPGSIDNRTPAVARREDEIDTSPVCLPLPVPL